MKKLKAIWLICLLGLLFSCKKEGCTDIGAKNFDTEAKQDNGTCIYPTDANAILFFGAEITEYLNYKGTAELNFYVDGVYETTILPSNYITDFPECGQDSTMSVYRDLGSQQTLTAEYTIYDQNNLLLWIGNIKFEADNCVRVIIHL